MNCTLVNAGHNGLVNMKVFASIDLSGTVARGVTLPIVSPPRPRAGRTRAPRALHAGANAVNCSNAEAQVEEEERRTDGRNARARKRNGCIAGSIMGTINTPPTVQGAWPQGRWKRLHTVDLPNVFPHHYLKRETTIFFLVKPIKN